MLDVLASAVPAFFPVLSDGLRGFFARATDNAGAAPQNAEEYIRVLEAETARLQALAEMERTGETFKWVNAIRALQRPFAVVAVLGAYTSVVVFGTETNPEAVDYLRVFAQSAVFYLFGDRTNWHSQRSGR